MKLLRVARPQFALAGLGLFAFGAAWAVLLGTPFSLPRFLLGYLVLLPAQLSVSYSNDYFDVEVDQYDQPTFFSGGSKILVDEPGLRRPALWVAIALTLCSLALGVVYQLAYSFSVYFSAFVVLGNLLGWFYSAPPLKLAYRGLGEVVMAVMIGLLIPGLGYLVMRGRLDGDALLFAPPLLLYGVALILIVEIPDMEADRSGDKRTWVARKGRGFGFTLIAGSFFLAWLYFFAFPLLTSWDVPVDLHFYGIIALIPLAAAWIIWLKRPLEKRAALRAAGWILLAFAVFYILALGYMLSLAFV